MLLLFFHKVIKTICVYVCLVKSFDGIIAVLSRSAIAVTSFYAPYTIQLLASLLLLIICSKNLLENVGKLDDIYHRLYVSACSFCTAHKALSNPYVYTVSSLQTAK